MPEPLLYDASNRPIRFRASAWDAAGQGRRAKNWIPTSSSINALLGGDVASLRRRSRDAIRRNPWAQEAIDSFVASAIGTGIRPKPQTQDDDFRREIADAWSEWCEEADADGTSDFYGLQALVTRAFREGGDCFIRFRPRRRSDGLSVPLQLQALEAEMVNPSLSRPLANGGVVKAGIEFGPFGRRVAYHMYRDHPGEGMLGWRGAVTKRINASQVIHVFHVLRPGQVRGVPGLAAVLARLHEVNEVDDAHVLRTKIHNLFATFETTPDQGISVLDGPGGVASAPTDSDDVPEVDIQPGSHIPLPPGHDIKFSTPPTDGTDYEAFIRVQLRAIAVGAGITYEQLTGDLTKVNFSSIRAGLIEFRRRMEQIQRNVLIFQFCRAVWRRWFETAVLSGRIQVPETERANMRRLLRAQWQAPGWEYVEPEKDVKAAVRRIRAGLSSRSREAAKTGIDVDELDREIAADNARAQSLGLVLDSDPSSDQDGAARAAAVGDAGDAGEAGEGGESGRDAA